MANGKLMANGLLTIPVGLASQVLPGSHVRMGGLDLVVVESRDGELVLRWATRADRARWFEQLVAWKISQTVLTVECALIDAWDWLIARVRS